MMMTSYKEIYDFQNLYQAYKRCCKGRRYQNDKIRFERELSSNLISLQTSLKEDTYRLSSYHTFKIEEPKERIIYITGFKDKIVQRLLCDNGLDEYIRNHVIYDNCACQKGKGVQFGLARITKFLHEYYRKNGNKGYILKTDIRNYYHNIDREVLKEQWKRIIIDERILQIIYQIIDSHQQGIIVGNQMSQHFAVYYMDKIDRYIKEELQVKYYSRYLDDSILIHENKRYLQNALLGMKAIAKELHLEFNQKTQIYPLKNGVDYLGWHIYLTDTGKVIKRMRTKRKNNTRRKLRKMNQDYQHGMIDMRTYNQKLQGMITSLK